MVVLRVVVGAILVVDLDGLLSVDGEISLSGSENSVIKQTICLQYGGILKYKSSH